MKTFILKHLEHFFKVVPWPVYVLFVLCLTQGWYVAAGCLVGIFCLSYVFKAIAKAAPGASEAILAWRRAIQDIKDDDDN